MAVKSNLANTLFFIMLVFVLYENQPVLGALLFFALGVVVQELILAQLIYVTLFESSLIVESGVTVSKILFILYIIYFILYIITKKIKIKFKGLNYIITFLIIVFLGLINVLFNQNVIDFAGGKATILYDFFIKYLPRILFFLLFVIYLESKGIKFIRKSILNIVELVNYFIFVLLIYFVSNYQIASWFNIVDRAFIENIDPNDFAIIVVSFIAFVSYNLFITPQFFVKILSISVYGIIFYLILLTASRSGFLTFIFATLVIMYFFDFIKISKKTFVIGFSLLLVISVIINSGIVDFNNILLRFTYYGNDINLTTAGRIDFWKNAFELFPNRPLIGYGISPFASRYYNGIGTGTPNVMHNIFIHRLNFIKYLSEFAEINL